MQTILYHYHFVGITPEDVVISLQKILCLKLFLLYNFI